MSQLKFSVVVCVYNGAERIRDTLKSLTAQDYPKSNYEVIVVDDHSVDDTARIVKRFRNVTLVTHETNQGVAVARNTGWKAAKGKWVAYLDDDCAADRNWLRQLETSLKEPKTIGAGGLIAPKDQRHILQRYLFHSGYGRPASVRAGAARGIFGRLMAYVKDMYQQAADTPRAGQVYEVYGANSAFLRSKIKALKGFDTTLRSAEDSDICRRLQSASPDMHITFNPAASVRHDYTASFVTYLRKLYKRQGDTWSYYRRQHKTPPVYPFPLIIAFATALSTSASVVWLPLAVLATLPIAIYGWWLTAAVRLRKPECIVYPYIQFLEESVRVAGLFYAGLTALRPRVPTRITMVSLCKIAIVHWLLFIIAEAAAFPGRAVVAGTFLLVTPGLLISLALRLRLMWLRSWLYVCGGSIVFLMLSALGANVVATLPKNDRAVGAGLLTMTASVFFWALLAIAYRRNRTAVFTVPAKIIRRITAASLWALLPFGGALGALILNHTDNNLLSIVAFTFVTLVSLGLIVWARRLSALSLAVILYAVSLSLLLSGALRGDMISGIDTVREYHLLVLVQQAGHWSPNLLQDAYNACLSITLLPLSLGKLLGVSDMAVLRVVLPALYALTPVAVYALVRSFVEKRTGIIAALFFIAQPAFITWSSVPLRQMTGILFFALMLLVIFDKQISPRARTVLFLLFGGSMVMSHYSTAYLGLGLLIVAYALEWLVHWCKHKQYPWNIHDFTPVLRLPLIVTLCTFAIFWYGPVTHASSNITAEMRSGWRAIRSGNWKIFDSGSHAQGTSIRDQFLVAPANPQHDWNNYLAHVNEKYSDLSIIPLQSKSDAIPIRPQAPAVMQHKVADPIVTFVAGTNQLLRKVARLFLLIGLVVYGWYCIRRSVLYNDQTFTLAAGLVLLAVIIVPHASIDYDVGRTSQQLLVLLALPVVVGGTTLLKPILRGVSHEQERLAIVGAMVCLLMLFVSGVPTQLTGGALPQMSLNNTGNQYDQWYVHTGEVSAADWLAQNKDTRSPIYGGYFGGNRLLFAGLDRPVTYNDILPWTIDQHSYVYVSTGETNGLATTYYNGAYLRYAYPTPLLLQTKSVLYDNGQARIYK